jgi:hypothetical protein
MAAVGGVANVVGAASAWRRGASRPAARARQAVFRERLFEGEWRHKLEVAVPEFHGPAFRAMLHYIHAGQVRKTPSWRRSWANFSLL